MLRPRCVWNDVMLCRWSSDWYSLPFPPAWRTQATKLAKIVHAHALSHPDSRLRLACAIHAGCAGTRLETVTCISSLKPPLASRLNVSRCHVATLSVSHQLCRGEGGWHQCACDWAWQLRLVHWQSVACVSLYGWRDHQGSSRDPQQTHENLWTREKKQNRFRNKVDNSPLVIKSMLYRKYETALF